MTIKLYENPVVFINYRRSDASSEAGRLASDLDIEFGEGFTFQDIDDIQSGDKWIDKLVEAGLEAKVILVMIGESWLEERNGQIRLFHTEDWVRKELIAAIEAKKIIIPILIDNATLPIKSKIPEELHSLLEYQAFPIRKARWKHDIKPLIQDLRNITNCNTLDENKKSFRNRKTKSKVWWTLGVAIMSIISIICVYNSLGVKKSWKRMNDMRIWMTENVNQEVVGSWCYDNKSTNCRKYGRLYTWQAAKEVCTDGWRLPSLEEWLKLTRSYGFGGKEIYESLVNNRSSGFNIKFAGSLSLGEIGFKDLGEKVTFWTRDIENGSVQFYTFDYNRGVGVSGGTSSKDVAYSCRCIRDH